MEANLEKALLNFGLSPSEIAVYLASLQQESATPSQLAKITNIPRTTIYDVVMALALKGLLKVKQATGMEKQQTLISAENPEKLRQIIRQKRSALLANELEMLDVIASLRGDYLEHSVSAKANTFVQSFIGQAQYDQYLQTSLHAQSLYPTYVWDNWMPIHTLGQKQGNQEVRDEIEVMKKSPQENKRLICLNERLKYGVVYQYQQNPDYFNYLEIRLIDNPLFQLEATVSIRHNRLYLTSVVADEIYGLIICSSSLANTFKSIFLQQWQEAKPLTISSIKNWQKTLS